ncbi:hypothetical protein GCM10027614_01910 [Micromonospora vulcania]
MRYVCSYVAGNLGNAYCSAVDGRVGEHSVRFLPCGRARFLQPLPLSFAVGVARSAAPAGLRGGKVTDAAVDRGGSRRHRAEPSADRHDEIAVPERAGHRSAGS